MSMGRSSSAKLQCAQGVPAWSADRRWSTGMHWLVAWHGAQLVGLTRRVVPVWLMTVRLPVLPNWVRAGRGVEGGELCSGVAYINVVADLELPDSWGIPPRACVCVTECVLVCLNAEVIVDEDGVSGDCQGAVEH